MKRANDDQVTRNFDASSYGSPPQPKRQKSSHACSSCRKHKTRCEQLDGQAPGSQRCHRCNVLNMPCSFDQAPATGPSMVQVASASKESPGRQIALEFNSPPDSPRATAQNMNPEDLIPVFITPWAPRKGTTKSDWTATPMLALQELARRPNSVQTQSYVNQASLSLIDIITPDQTLFLLEIFDSRFKPWFEVPLSCDVHSSLLDLVRCTIASRHLDVVTRSVVAPRLQRLTEEAILKELFNPMPSIESIHALLILSYWSPLPSTPQVEIRDGRLLAASAVSMAMNLRLGHASEFITGLQDRRRVGNCRTIPNAQEVLEAKESAYLWICLSNAESMLCIGTGREPLSRRSETDYTFISSCISIVETGREIRREMRLGLMAQMFDLAEKGHRIHFTRYSEMDKWHKEVLDVLVKLEGLHRILLPLPVVAEQDAFQYHMLLFYYHFCRLIVLHQAIREARRVLQDYYPGKPWYKEFVHQGANLALIWGQEAILTAEAVLVTHLSRPENLTSAPDIVFTMVSFAAVFLIIAKFGRFQARGEHLPGASDSLITKVVERLSQSALTTEHTPAKCALIVSASFKAFAEITSTTTVDSQGDATTSVGHAVSAERLSASRPVAPDPASSVTEPTQGPDILSYGYNQFMDSDGFLDTNFWSSFMDHLSTESV